MLTDIISKQPQFVNNTTMFLAWKTFVFTNNTKASPGKQSAGWIADQHDPQPHLRLCGGTGLYGIGRILYQKRWSDRAGGYPLFWPLRRSCGSCIP